MVIVGKIFALGDRFMFRKIILPYMLCFVGIVSVAAEPFQGPFRSDKNNIIVVIDPAHGGSDLGVIGHSGTTEKDITLAIAKNIEVMIKDALPNIQVHLTRVGDVSLTNYIRTDMIVEKDADIFISLHSDGSMNDHTSGMFVVYYSDIEPAGYSTEAHSTDNTIDPSESILLGRTIADSIQRDLLLSEPIRIMKYPSSLLKNVIVPAIIINLGFLTNPLEESQLKLEATQKKISHAIIVALDAYYNIWALKHNQQYDNGTNWTK